ncbi:hypothetical protein EK904_012183 [Melospiza melodia maxima]|nr:hypothetical protein EK904_012183 [Melospiza melodia maxima]
MAAMDCRAEDCVAFVGKKSSHLAIFSLCYVSQAGARQLSLLAGLPLTQAQSQPRLQAAHSAGTGKWE